MQNIRIYLFTYLSFMWMNCLVAQQESKIIVGAKSIGHQVNLRWSPSDFDAYQSGRINGYKIVRQTISIGNSPLTAEEIVNSRLTFNNGSIKPMTYTAWQAANPGHAMDAAMNGFLNNSGMTPPAGEKLSDAVDYNMRKKNTLFYVEILAGNDFQLAKALGLAYQDETVSMGNEYTYIISLLGQDTVLCTSSVTIKIGETTTDLKPAFLDKMSKDRVIGLSWNFDLNYSSYDIFRSGDNGSTYTKVNGLPFIFATTEEDVKEIYYQDSVPLNNHWYSYKIQGRTAYGTIGPLSDTIMAKALPPPLAVLIQIDTIYYNVAGLPLLKWSVIGEPNPKAAFNSLVTTGSLTWRDDLDNVMTNVKNFPISENIVVSTNSFKEGHFNIIFKDMYGHEYASGTAFIQPVDSIPPHKPIGLSGTINNYGSVNLNWTANTDDDVKGYKVFYSYGRNLAYAETTKTYVSATKFIHAIDAQNANDSIYYKIYAIDKRMNYSVISDPIALKIPDRMPPSQPLISKINPTQQGLKISWRLSESSDLSHHVLERKLKNAAKWTLLTTITNPNQYPDQPLVAGESFPVNYIDTDSLLPKTYVYRLVAIDKSNNKASSRIIQAKPYDDGLRGKLQKLMGVKLGANTSFQGEIGPGVEIVAPDQIVVRLNWEYTTTHPATLKGFEIYQSYPDDQILSNQTSHPINIPAPTNVPYILLKTVKATDAKIIAQKNNVFEYAIILDNVQKSKHNGIAYYKVIAVHKDGGFSQPDTVSVVVH